MHIIPNLLLFFMLNPGGGIARVDIFPCDIDKHQPDTTACDGTFVGSPSVIHTHSCLPRDLYMCATPQTLAKALYDAL